MYWFLKKYVYSNKYGKFSAFFSSDKKSDTGDLFNYPANFGYSYKYG